ncbi:GntR family transcriptional regulator [Conexibacter woesei]|uniref:Transcriptional regulator, GntR family n=1 Tax=Conexibacter woesei (strain DSM 14684 / CCUG 47730 / CIP 108061 / JCM 11494 / NBRC 100937 / ID131577) TaxID=469383 RepID=D3F3E3_CONWI|nr:GntR family transcriptional regulator [Conexibacter woesei]ADB52308.1 transcriptional regulator, GntR family [Conexibacter woesei DSM 14684]
MSRRARRATDGNGTGRAAAAAADAPAIARPARQTAGDQAEEAVFEAIMDGKIPPGSPLRLQELAEQLGMSIMPVREALRRLEGLGLVEIVAHKGAWVRPLTLEDLHDTYFTRLNLECLAMRTAAGRFSAEDGAVAREALDEHVAARRRGDQVGARNAHERFHFTMYRACGSDWLVRSIGPAWRNSERYRVESMRHPAHVARRAEEHVQMLAALEEGDAEAAVALLASHLRSSVELVAAGLDGDPAATRVHLPSLDELLPRSSS